MTPEQIQKAFDVPQVKPDLQRITEIVYRINPTVDISTIKNE